MTTDKKVKAVEVIIDEKTPQFPVSQTKADYAALIAAYAKKNPAKYEVKKEALEARLAAMQ